MSIVLITGANSGFGKELVLSYLKSGHQVIASMRNCDQRKSEFDGLQNNHLSFIEFDVANSNDRKDVVSYINQKFGALDILVNNAGFALYGALEDISEEQLRYQMEVNFFAPTLIIKDFIPLLRNSKVGGKIFNLNSVAGLLATPLGAHYSASKFALEGMTQGLLFELSGQGIQLCSVCPGGHRTNFLKNIQWANGKNEKSLYSSDYTFLESMMGKISKKSGVPLQNVTQEIIKLSNQKKIPARFLIGKDAAVLTLLKKTLGTNLFYSFLGLVYNKLKK
jgi:NAD(P)-dependent dehydrogenase (short-subunit alcohol dehydrogenase family)